jgi:hypothetical protein
MRCSRWKEPNSSAGAVRSLPHRTCFEGSRGLQRQGKGESLPRMNIDPLFTFQDGSHLVISTQCSKEGTFSCTLYTVLISADDGAACRIVSTHLEAETCLRAQAYAYEHAVQLYPRTAHIMKKPPYLIWHGPNA